LGSLRQRVKVRLDDSRLSIRDVMLRSADRYRSGRSATSTAAAHADQVGVYLTDGVFLYRVDDVLVTRAGEMADLEDCYWLDVVRVPMNDLRARRLRVVTPTPFGAEAKA
jgi:hypothetical protein